MAIVALSQGTLWIPNSANFGAAVPGFGSAGGLTAANSRVACVFQVPKTGTLDWFEIRQQANTNTPDNGVRFSFQDIDASGNPDDTEDQYSVVTTGFAAGAWLVPPSYMGAGGPGSGAKRSVTKGEWLACSLRFESFVASDNITISGHDNTSRVPGNWMLNTYWATSADAGVTYSKTEVEQLNFALKYDDGTYAYLDAPHGAYSAVATQTFNSGSTPDERGLLFQIPFVARLAGISARVAPSAAFDVVLYDAASGVLITETIPFANSYATSGANAFYRFATPQSLSINVNYRAVIKPGASNVTMYDYQFNASAIRAANPGGSTWQLTTRTNAGAWSETDTSLPILGLVFDGFDDGTGGSGGGEHSAVF